MAYWTRAFLEFDALHKELFNEEGWRKSLTSPYMRWAETGTPPNRYVTGDFGTLYHDYGDGSAHYMAFRIVGSRLVSFMDPSGSTGPYQPTDAETALIRQQFPGREIRYVFPGQGPQHNPNDTLCQTWSLGWLMGMDDTLHRAASRMKHDHAVDEAEEILNAIRDHMTSHPHPEASEWIRLYNRARPHLIEYFLDRVPTSTRPPRRNLFG